MRLIRPTDSIKIYRPFGMKQDHRRTGNRHFLRLIVLDCHRHLDNAVASQRTALMPLNMQDFPS